MGIFTFPLLVGLFLFERDCCQVSPPLFSYRWFMNGYQSELRQKNSTIGDLQCRWFKRTVPGYPGIASSKCGYLCAILAVSLKQHWFESWGEFSKITSNQWLSPCTYYINPPGGIKHPPSKCHSASFTLSENFTHDPSTHSSHQKKMWRMLRSM